MMDVLGLIDPLDPLFWFVAGAALLVVEVLMPAFLALGFGLAAWVMALLMLVLPAETLSGAGAMMVWAVLSAVTWILLRIVFRNRFSGNKAGEGDINEY
jgi:membrane protein implicated in regulation of membrane protease activity